MVKNKIKIFLNDSYHYMRAFDADKYERVDDINYADIVIFTGGEDVTPSLYDEKKHMTTGCNINRDLIEKKIYEKAGNRLKIGICRGSQFLTVMSGGKLVQDCNNHAIYNSHSIKTIDGKGGIKVTSTHHQMMHPYNLPADTYSILAWTEGMCSYKHLSPTHDADLGLKEPEIVFYNKTNCLCVQGHPEYNHAEISFVNYFNELVDKYYEENK